MAAIHSDEFKRDAVRITLTSGLTRRQVASDLGIGLSTLGKWVRAVSEEAKVPAQYAELLRENERLRKENRNLWEDRVLLRNFPQNRLYRHHLRLTPPMSLTIEIHTSRLFTKPFSATLNSPAN